MENIVMYLIINTTNGNLGSAWMQRQVTYDGAIEIPQIPYDWYGMGEFSDSEYTEIKDILNQRYWRHGIDPTYPQVRRVVEQVEGRRNN